ncbi:MAG TPA: hypothetical protein VF631_13660 [Allosphingosinicella sp.]|jgi:hypothetical protein|uniref:hypothetical protein n=1 Tax=Allosphingosinicella sp. TaxID=2823234 RepID=UPI002F296A5E
MPIAQHSNAYMSVYQVVEELCSGDCPPAGLTGAMFSAIDDLRRMQAPRADVTLAERISVAMHKLEWAIRSGDAAVQEEIRAELQALGSDWLDTPICRH